MALLAYSFIVLQSRTRESKTLSNSQAIGEAVQPGGVGKAAACLEMLASPQRSNQSYFEAHFQNMYPTIARVFI
jgi:hypothetical protein